jgi:hypothetical protein
LRKRNNGQSGTSVHVTAQLLNLVQEMYDLGAAIAPAGHRAGFWCRDCRPPPGGQQLW